MNLSEQIELAATWIAASRHHVVFTGAGISTDSGLPDYRGPDGVWTRRDKGLPPPAMKPLNEIKPNRAHHALVELQRLGRLRFLISQNVDNLHLASGMDPTQISELHGNSKLVRCGACDTQFRLIEVGWDRCAHGNGYRTEVPVAGQPTCRRCQGRLYSSIVNFGDSMPIRELELAQAHSAQCDLFFAIGSSLVVSPANDMPAIACRKGARLILLNRGETPFDEDADLLMSAGIGEVLPAIASAVKRLMD